MTLEQMIEMTSTAAERMFARAGTVGPMWVVETRNGDRHIIPAPEISNKDLMAELIRVLLADMDAVRVVFVDECWTVFCKTDAEEQVVKAWYDNHDDLEEFPGRQEVVGLHGEDESGRMLCGSRTIIRKRSKATLGPLETYSPQASEGRMTGWLPARGIKQQ
jgi:hypothetical protein